MFLEINITIYEQAEKLPFGKHSTYHLVNGAFGNISNDILYERMQRKRS